MRTRPLAECPGYLLQPDTDVGVWARYKCRGDER